MRQHVRMTAEHEPGVVGLERGDINERSHAVLASLDFASNDQATGGVCSRGVDRRFPLAKSPGLPDNP